MKNSKRIVMFIAVMLVMCFAAMGTMAYFNSISETGGVMGTVSIVPSAELVEEKNLVSGEDGYSEYMKKITVEADSETALAVRVLVFCPTTDGLSFNPAEDSSEKWTTTDGITYNYTLPLEKEGVTEALILVTDGLKAGSDSGKTTTIPVILEYTQAVYKADGTFDAAASWAYAEKEYTHVVTVENLPQD